MSTFSVAMLIYEEVVVIPENFHMVNNDRMIAILAVCIVSMLTLLLLLIERHLHILIWKQLLAVQLVTLFCIVFGIIYPHIIPEMIKGMIPQY